MGAVAICQENNLNTGLDLMFGLPEQTLKDLEEDLKCAMTLSPNHISFYQLTVPLKNNKWQKFEMPSEELLLDEFRLGKRMLGKMGWNQYEISNYAKDGYECRPSFELLEMWPIHRFGGRSCFVCCWNSFYNGS